MVSFRQPSTSFDEEDHLTLKGISSFSDGFDPLVELIAMNESPARVTLSSSNFSGENSYKFASALAGNRSLQELYCHQLLWDGTLELFADTLRGSKTLLHLKIDSCNIGDAGARYIAAALKENSSLVSLSLPTNNIRSKGAKDLADALMENNTLRRLQLQFNKLDDIGAESLAGALKLNDSITALHLNNNLITGIGLRALTKSLEMNKSLVELDIWVLGEDAALAKVKTRTEANRQRKQQVFLQTLKSGETAPWNRSRLMFVGQGRAGKTATVRSLLGHPFSIKTESTVGAHISESTVFSSIWKETDLPRNFSHRLAARLMLNGEKESPSKAKSQVPKKQAWNTFKRALKLTKNKANLKEDIKATGEDFGIKTAQASDHHALDRALPEVVKTYDESYLVDARHDANSVALSLWDFGGQFVFYSMHHIFLTKTGMYMLVFDQRDLLRENETNLQNLSFWLRSIRLHAPLAPVILAGTFSHEIKEKLQVKTIDNLLKGFIEDFGTNVVFNQRENLYFHAIDNKYGTGISNLRSSVEAATLKDVSVSQEVSVRWMGLLDQIIEKRKSSPYLTFSQVRDIGKGENILTQSELETALSLFHERGFVVHLTSTNVLKQIIVLKPQWLVDCLCKVIRDKSLHSFNEENFRKVGLLDDMKILFAKGQASRDLLDYLWENEPVEFLLDLMKRTMLLSELNLENKLVYIIPSLLQSDHFPDSENMYKCEFDFSASFLPAGVFQRLICLCVEGSHRNNYEKGTMSNQKNIALYQNYGMIEFEKGCVIRLQECKNTQTIIVHVKETENGAKCYNVVQSLLHKVNADAMGTGLSWEVKFETRNSADYVSFAESQSQRISPWFQKEGKLDHPSVQNTNLDDFLEAFRG